MVDTMEEPKPAMNNNVAQMYLERVNERDQKEKAG